MDFGEFKSKQDLLAYVAKEPNMVAFEGWDRYGTPKLSTSGEMQTWVSAQKLPFYDEEIEKAILQASNRLGRSAMESGHPELNIPATTRYSRPKMKFLQEATPFYGALREPKGILSR